MSIRSFVDISIHRISPFVNRQIQKNPGSAAWIRHCPGIFSKKQQRNPRHNIVPVLELDPAALQRGNNVDALTFHAGVHPLRVAARQAVLDGAPGADGAGFRGQDIRFHTLFPEEAAHLIGDVLVVGAGSEGLVDVGDVRDLRDGGDHQAVFVAHTLLLTCLHAADAGRARPAFAVHGAFVLADPPDALGEFQLLRIEELVAVQGQLRQLFL